MPESPAELLAHAAAQLRVDADRAERKGRSVLLDAHEVRPIADWLAFEARCLAENAQEDPASELALNVARALLGETS